MMLDSGAFSAWTRGIHLDLDEYTDFFFTNEDLFDFVVGIDKLPSFFGDTCAHRLIKEFESSAEISWRNTEYLLSQGMTKKRLIPVFHQGEDFKWLEFLLKQDFFLLGISPGNDRSSQDKRMWIGDCLDIIGVNSEGYANQRCHGFAVTDWYLAKMFPWFSVDSATWCISAGHGNILVPDKNFTDFLNPKFISMGRKRQDHHRGLEEYTKSHLKMTLEDLKSVHTNRVLSHLYVMDKFSQLVRTTKPYLKKTRSTGRMC